MTEDRSFEEGRLVAHYRLVGPIGEGGMGLVYKAWDTRLDRPVALKLLKSDIRLQEQSRARLLREAKLASALNHPCIATVYGLEHVEGRDVIAMEYVEGQTLGERLRAGTFEVREVIDLALSIADALAEAHAAGVVHRDIKPDNLILTPRGYPKVMDFGLARLAQGEPDDGAGSSPTRLTAEGAVMGTVAYMSPEQATGREAGAPADVFAFGVVLYEMLARCPAFSGDSDVDVLYDILHRAPRPIRELNPDVPEDLAAVVARCTQKDPAERYADARELHGALKLARSNLDAQRSRTLATLLGVSREMASILDLEPLLQRIASLVKSLIDYDVLGIFRVDEAAGRLIWLGGAGYEVERARHAEYPVTRGVCGRAIRTRRAVRVGEAAADSEYYAPNGEDFSSNLAVPLIHQDRVIAVLNMESRRPHFFTTEHVTLMDTLAGFIAVAIANVELFDERRRHVHALETLHEIGRQITSILDPDSLLDRVAELTRKIVDYDLFGVFLLDDEGAAFIWRCAIGYDPIFVRDRKLLVGEGVISRAVAQRSAVIVGDSEGDPDYIAARTADGRVSRSEVAVPLHSQERVLGVLTLESATPGRFDAGHAALLTVLASQVAVALENARLYRELHDRARQREIEAEHIRQRFESYVTPHIAEQVFREPGGRTLAGERREVTVLVADVRGFTAVSEALAPEAVVRFLQEFFSIASHVVFKYEGTVDKFLGDALMAFYGAPLAHDPRYGPADSQRAVFAALDLRDAFQKLRDKWWQRHDGIGALDLCIGVNSGPCLLGNMGSDRRVEYTAIGETVNQAFRLCREAAPGEIRVGGTTLAEVHEDMRVEPLPPGAVTSDPAAQLVVGHKYLP